MILAICMDDRNGMLFNKRRQSQDRAVREDLAREAGGGPLWVNAYSRKQFGADAPGCLREAEDFLEQAGPGELCFVEDRDPAPWAERAEGLIVYRWNRKYPADVACTVPLERWTLARQEEFPGSSHETITKEVYRR